MSPGWGWPFRWAEGLGPRRPSIRAGAGPGTRCCLRSLSGRGGTRGGRLLLTRGPGDPAAWTSRPHQLVSLLLVGLSPRPRGCEPSGALRDMLGPRAPGASPGSWRGSGLLEGGDGVSIHPVADPARALPSVHGPAPRTLQPLPARASPRSPRHVAGAAMLKRAAVERLTELTG